MRSTASSIITLLLSLSHTIAAVSIDCDHIRIDGKKYDVSKLAGRHSTWVHDTSRPPAEYNTTWTVDLCAPLKKLDDIPNKDQCPHGTRVCGVVSSWNPIDDPKKKHVQTENVIPIAGNFDSSTGASLAPNVTRLSAHNASLDGLHIEFNGGNYNHNKQRAIIRLQCDKERTGNDRRSIERRAKNDDDDDDDGDDSDDDDNNDRPEQKCMSDLQFVSYEKIENQQLEVLQLNWKTKYVCEDYVAGDDPDEEEPVRRSGWGFFTWFILIAFLGIAAYLIFGAWLNYNRYGARGWDLLPHGDTIRDIPYLVKDFSKKVADTVSGGGSRGGYSAV